MWRFFYIQEWFIKNKVPSTSAENTTLNISGIIFLVSKMRVWQGKSLDSNWSHRSKKVLRNKNICTKLLQVKEITIVSSCWNFHKFHSDTPVLKELPDLLILHIYQQESHCNLWQHRIMKVHVCKTKPERNQSKHCYWEIQLIILLVRNTYTPNVILSLAIFARSQMANAWWHTSEGFAIQMRPL